LLTRYRVKDLASLGQLGLATEPDLLARRSKWDQINIAASSASLAMWI
jgi:hypothetical protein